MKSAAFKTQKTKNISLTKRAGSRGQVMIVVRKFGSWVGTKACEVPTPSETMGLGVTEQSERLSRMGSEGRDPHVSAQIRQHFGK